MVFSLGVVLAAAVTHYPKQQGLFGAGVGIFTIAVLWPGFLTACLVFFDGLKTEGASRWLLLRSIAWGLLPIVYIVSLSRFGIQWIRAFTSVEGIGVVYSFVLFISPSLITAFFGITLRRRTKEKAEKGGRSRGTGDADY